MGSLMKVLLISQYYKPEPVFYPTEVAEHFALNGHNVTVITSHPNYPKGKFYDNFTWWKPVASVENGVRVIRLPIFPDHSDSKIRRFLNYSSFAIVAFFASFFIGIRPNLVWVYQTPFTNALGGLWFKKLFGSKVIFFYADLWPESFLAASILRQGFLIKALYFYRSWINKKADYIFTITNGMRLRYLQDGLAENSIESIPLWIEKSTAEIRELSNKIERDFSKIVYVGNIGPSQQLEILIEAASLLKHMDKDFSVQIYGSGTDLEKLRKMTREFKLSNVFFNGTVSLSESVLICSNSLAQFVHLRNSPMFEMTIPSKLIFSFYCGSPILCGLPGESQKIAAESGASYIFEPGNPASLAAEIKMILSANRIEIEKKGLAGRNFYQKYYERIATLNQLVQKCEMLVNKI